MEVGLLAISEYLRNFSVPILGLRPCSVDFISEYRTLLSNDQMARKARTSVYLRWYIPVHGNDCW